jgi:hypothetical protein
MSDDGADFILKLVDANGVAVSSVKDGHILVFKKSYLKDILDKNPDSDKLIIFVKKPEFKN